MKDNLDCQGILLWGFPENKAWDNDWSGVDLEGDIQKQKWGNEDSEAGKGVKATKEWIIELVNSVGNWGSSPFRAIWELVEQISELSHQIKWKWSHLSIDFHCLPFESYHWGINIPLTSQGNDCPGLKGLPFLWRKPQARQGDAKTEMWHVGRMCGMSIPAAGRSVRLRAHSERQHEGLLHRCGGRSWLKWSSEREKHLPSSRGLRSEGSNRDPPRSPQKGPHDKGPALNICQAWRKWSQLRRDQLHSLPLSFPLLILRPLSGLANMLRDWGGEIQVHAPFFTGVFKPRKGIKFCL